MSFIVRFTINNDNPVQPTGLPDWIALCYISTATVAILISIIIMLIRGGKYAPLRAKDVPKIIVMGIFGLIHIWFAFMTNEHFEFLTRLQRFQCSVFSFWLQYLLGLNMWFIVLVLRLETYIWIFSERTKNVTKLKFRVVQLITTLALTIPLIGLCIIVSSTNGSIWDEGKRQCTTDILYKFILLGWIVAEMILLITIFFMMKKILTSNYYKEYEPLGNIILLGITIIIVNGFIVVFGGLSYSIGRAIATILIGTLHVFTLFRLAGYTLWKATICDNRYATRFITSQKNALVGVYRMEDIIDDPENGEIIDDFLKYCNQQKDFSYTDPNREGVKFTVYPIKLAKCREDMIVWRQKRENNRDVKNECFDILRKYIMCPDSSEYISPNTKLVHAITQTDVILNEFQPISNQEESHYATSVNTLNRNDASSGKESDSLIPVTLFDPLIRWIVLHLGQFWGKSYLTTDIRERSIWASIIQRKLVNSGDVKITGRLEDARLLEYWGFNTRYEFSIGNDDDNEVIMTEFSPIKPTFEPEGYEEE